MISGTFETSSGASGDVSIIAPLPGPDSAVVPITFFTAILAHTDEPHSKLNGAALSILTGTIHYIDATMV